MKAPLVALPAMLIVGLLAPWSAARADIYGFLDERGVTHFATERVDERYTLFFRDGDRGATSGTTAGTAADAKPGKLVGTKGINPQADLQRTLLFQRVAERAKIYGPLIARIGREEGVDESLLQSVIAVESGFDPLAVSSKGAVGLMQMLPDTAARYGLAADKKRTVAQKLTEPEISLRLGARYLRDLMDEFKDLNLALAAYNAGENAVRRFDNHIPPFPETQGYVKTVQQFYAFYRPRGFDQFAWARAASGRRNMPASITGARDANAVGTLQRPLVIPDEIAKSVPILQIP